ncbi:hypothetical protein G7077_07850 [Sphingomonas piscis]|uniref:DUF4139 domain-containing protein n=1 Tax=Sphingomonas piscis TaxID=2714943 RepID=A0A6G7YQ04_9SPHN|nr:hypothetical protein [Sphingomonas piscis]QIK78822.1 hypothetical protein G7077_07850 [Sphingomonas piscis]
MMRRFAMLMALALSGTASAQPVVTSAGPDKVAVTVYRDPARGTRQFDLGWLQGYALVSETRRVTLPAGESEVRFEGVTAGIVPQSAIVTGLGEAVIEKNRDARLLSPGTLLAANLGQRLLLRRTSKATGQVREQEAVLRATEDGVVLQTAQGFEALRCSGINETLLARDVPLGLSAKPTLSVRVRSPQSVERDVTLSYISNNFDWQANYVGELSSDGRKLSLFAWLTIANGDDTGLADAATQAVAGKLNREYVWVSRGEATPIRLNCWPSGTTGDRGDELQESDEIIVTGRRIQLAVPRAVSAPAPPPPPSPERDVMAEEERLGDVRLYRVPIEVTVAAHSQKQVAFMRQPAVQVESLLRLRPDRGDFDRPIPRLLVTRNERSKGLGLPLPAGSLTLFGTREGRRILIGEGRIDDHTTGEKVEVTVASSTAIWARQRAVPDEEGGGYRLTLTNDLSTAQMAEVELPLGTKAVKVGKLTKRDGWMLWRVRLPANGSRELRYK